MIFVRRWSIAIAAAIAFAVPLSAQNRALGDPVEGSPGSAAWTAAPSTSLASPVAVGPTIASLLPPSLAQQGQRQYATSAPTSASLSVPLQQERGRGRPVATMVVGGIGLVVGSLIGGDTGTIVMAAGGVVGLIGLYRYLR